MTAASRSGVSVVNVPWCRKKGICDTDVVNKFNIDTGSNILPVHQETAYLVEPLDHFGYRIASLIALNHPKAAMEGSSRSGVPVVDVLPCCKEDRCETGDEKWDIFG